MANEIWQQEEQKFLRAIQDVRVPNEKLEEVPFIIPHSKEDFEQIPESGGCYWIWTNEPALHSLHKNKIPASFNEEKFQIVPQKKKVLTIAMQNYQLRRSN